MGYALSPAARADIEEIWDYTVRHWGEAQAERYTRVSGCRKARENGEHKMWGLTFSNFMFSHTGPLMAGSLLTAMDAPVSGGCVVSPEGP